MAEAAPDLNPLRTDKAKKIYNEQYKGFKMPGMTLATLKQKWSLIPLFVCVGGGCVAASFYLVRLATKNLDVTWRSQEKQPWERVAPTYQYKFYSPNIDYSKLKVPAERPDI